MKMNASRSPLQKGNIKKDYKKLNTILTKTGTGGNRADHFWKSTGTAAGTCGGTESVTTT